MLHNIDDMGTISYKLMELAVGFTVRGVRHDFRGVVLGNYCDNQFRRIAVRSGPYQILMLPENEPVRIIMMSSEEYNALQIRKCDE